MQARAAAQPTPAGPDFPARTADTSPALAYTVWVSTDLADWGVAPVAATQVPRSPVIDGVETVDVTLDAYAAPPGGKLFVRVQAQ